MAKPNTYELIVNPDYVDSLTAGSLAVSDFRHDFFGASLLGAEKTKSFETTLNEVKNMLPRCPGWDKELAATPADPPCNGTGGGGYRRVEDTKGMEEYLDASLSSIKAAIAAQHAPGEELELPGSVFAKLKYKVRVLSKSAEDRIERGFHDILAGHKLGFVVDTYTSTFKYLIHDSLSEPKRTYPLIWINNNATAFDPATKSYPGSGKASDKSSIGRRMISVENEEEVAAVWRDGKLPYRDMYETILYSPWPEERQNVSLNDATIENNLFFSKGDITQRRESSASNMPLIDLNVNGIDWTIPSSSVAWISAQIQNLWLQPSSKLKKIWTAKKSTKKSLEKSTERFRQQEHAIPVSHDADEGGGDDEGEGDGGKGAHPGAASPEQFRILSDTFSNIKETPIPGFLALSKRLGDQGQALSCRRKELYSGILPVFVTIDQLAFVAAVMYNIPAAIFCGKGGKKGPGPTFMIYKESLDDPVLRLGNIIENFKSILKKPPPSLPEMNKRADHLLSISKIMEGEWGKIAAQHQNLEDETQYKNFLRKIISLKATSNIIKDVTNVQKKIAELHMPDGLLLSGLDAALSNPDPPPAKDDEDAEDDDEVAPAAGALARILKTTPNLIPEKIQKNAFLGDTNSKDKGAIQARSAASIAILQRAAIAALGIQLRDFSKLGNVTLGVAAALLARAGYHGLGGDQNSPPVKITKAFAEHPKLLDPLYVWLADQADEYLGFMKTLISLNDLLDAADKSAKEQEKAEKRKLGKVNAAAIKNIQLTPEGAKSTDDFKSQFEKLTPMRVTYSGAEQLKIANDILIIINKQAEFSQIVTGFWDRAIEAAEKKDTGLSEPWFFGYSFEPPTRSSARNVIEKIPPNVWLSQLYEFIKVHMDWTEDGGGGDGGGGGGGGDGGGGGGGGDTTYTTEAEMVEQWPMYFEEGQSHEESLAASAAAMKGGGKKGDTNFTFENDEIIRTYVGIVLVTMDLIADSDAVDRAHLDNEMRKGLSTFLGGDIAVDNAIAAISYAFTQDPASAASAAAAINEPQASGNIQIVKGGIFAPTFYNQLKRLNLEVGNGEHLLQYLRQNILKVSSRPALIYLPGDEINIKPMVESLQRQVKTSLEAYYGFTAAAPPAAAAGSVPMEVVPPQLPPPVPATSAAAAAAAAGSVPMEVVPPQPPPPPTLRAPAAAAAAVPTTPRGARRRRAPRAPTATAPPSLKRRRDGARQGNKLSLKLRRVDDGGVSDGDDAMGVAARGGKRKKKRTRRRKPKKRRKRSKKKRKPKKKQTRRRKPKKKRTRRRKPKKKRTRRRRR